MKKQTVIALVLLLLIPVVLLLGGLLFSAINPEIAAGHANYARNYHLLSLLRNMMMLVSVAIAGSLWLLACFLVIRSKARSPWWLVFAALGPIGFAILASLSDARRTEPDPYERFVRSLNRFVRLGYEVCTLVIIWLVAYNGMVLKRNLMIMYESFTTGLSPAQIIDQQNASSGMWAFGEGMEVMYLAVLLYVIRPIVFNSVSRLAAMATPAKLH